MRVRSAAAALLVPLSLSACIRGRGHGDAQSATLEVTSNYIGPLDLFAARDNGFVQRIGNVSSSRTTRFRLDASLIGGAGAIRIIAVPVADNGRASTGQIVVRPGDVVQFNIAPSLQASTVFVR